MNIIHGNTRSDSHDDLFSQKKSSLESGETVNQHAGSENARCRQDADIRIKTSCKVVCRNSPQQQILHRRYSDTQKPNNTVGNYTLKTINEFEMVANKSNALVNRLPSGETVEIIKSSYLTVLIPVSCHYVLDTSAHRRHTMLDVKSLRIAYVGRTVQQRADL